MWIGKLLGGLIGFATFNIFGAIIGVIIGNMFDKGLSGTFQVFSPDGLARRQKVFFETTFTLMGMIAKSDGRISEEEIAHTENYMTQLGLTPEHRREAISLFKTGANADLESLLKEFNEVCIQANVKQMLLVHLVGISLADGVFDPAEENLLRQIAQSLGFDGRSFEHLVQMIRNQSHFHQQGGSYNASSKDDLQAAYEALGVTETATDAEIKKAYRKLMSQYHPDKLMGQGVPEDMIKVATERSQEVQTAYDLIKKSRGNK
ncbi:MAG: co-chaperone DjlA [Cellvibrionaceae bacterium]